MNNTDQLSIFDYTIADLEELSGRPDVCTHYKNGMGWVLPWEKAEHDAE